MHLCIIIPAHNEEKNLRLCLDSFVAQSCKPHELIVVDDNSSDNTLAIAQEYAVKHSWIKTVQNSSLDVHVPGKKVVDSFNVGLQLAQPYDLVGKFDADIVLPPTYFETLIKHFSANPNLGMCSGLLYILEEGEWIYETIADKNHIRGPIKLYTKACFTAINGLRASIGWDTVDVLLAQYHGFDVLTDASLKVKHLRPTGSSYSTTSKLLKGEALYKMRYGLVLCCIAAAKMGYKQQSKSLFLHTIKGYLKAKKNNIEPMVTSAEGKFIRKLRWKKMKQKLF